MKDVYKALSIEKSLFALGIQKELQETTVNLSFITLDEEVVIEEKIRLFLNEGKRSGGSELLKEIDKVEYFKRGLVEHLLAIKDILAREPKVRERKKQSEVVKETQNEAIERIAESWKNMDEALSRSFVERMIGRQDIALSYTKDELPYVIALYQVRNEVLKVEE